MLRMIEKSENMFVDSNVIFCEFLVEKCKMILSIYLGKIVNTMTFFSSLYQFSSRQSNHETQTFRLETFCFYHENHSKLKLRISNSTCRMKLESVFLQLFVIFYVMQVKKFIFNQSHYKTDIQNIYFNKS